MENLYQEIIMDHYRSPRGKGLREPFEAQIHHVNPTCGDEVTLRVHLEGSHVQDISYQAMGCSISQASTSIMYEQLVDKDLAEVWPIHEEFVRMIQGRGQVAGDEELLGDGIALVGVASYPARVKCALLGWMGFKDAALQALGRDLS